MMPTETSITAGIIPTPTGKSSAASNNAFVVQTRYTTQCGSQSDESSEESVIKAPLDKAKSRELSRLLFDGS